MKLWISLLLVCAILLGLCACSKPISPAVTSEPTGSTEQTDPTKPTENRVLLQSLLEPRNLPPLKSRDEMLAILQTEVYGMMPPAPTKTSYSIKKNIVSSFCAGKAEIHEVTVNCTVKDADFSFKFRIVLPKKLENVPFFIYIGFGLDTVSRYMPTEELVDNGYAILYFNYEDIATDDKYFDNGLSAILFPDGTRNDTDPGKLAMWAWAAHRLMDYAETLSGKLDLSRSVVCGHSRTGKAALLAGATDTRIQFTYSNDSGCSGAAISRGKFGEKIDRIMDLFPFWFCKNYKKYIANENNMPFDQHYLLASIAPRKVLVGSASNDLTADYISEQLACLAASPAFEKGFACTVLAKPGDEFFEGDIGYHLRPGDHYFSRTDWQKLIKFVNYHSSK